MTDKNYSDRVDAINEAMKTLEKLTIKHPAQETAKERIQFLANHSSSVSLIVLAGPSGAGKSTLLDRLIESFRKQHGAAMQQEPSSVPIVYTLAVANGHRCFDFKRLYSDALKSLGDPFAVQRAKNRRAADPSRVLNGETKSSARLREDLEHEMLARGTLIWIIDEAHHVVRGGKSGQPGDQYDILKSFAQITGVKLVLAGTYDLPQHLAASGQLARRSETVQLPRYRWHETKERACFLSVVNTILKTLPVESYPDVAANAQYFYVWSVGCVGIAKDWIARAFALALQKGAKELTMEHLEAGRLSAEQLENISADLERGEQFMTRFTKHELDEHLLDRILGRTAGKARTQKPPAAKPPARRKPGERGLGRDSVGDVAA